MKGNLKLVVQAKPQPSYIQNEELLSVRKELNTSEVTFNYQNFESASLTAGQVLYQEGFDTDDSTTYIKVVSEQSQTIGASPSGIIELTVYSNGIATQLDKTIPISIGANTINLVINFESRPDTLDFELTSTSYQTPIQIKKQDILDNSKDFDGSTIVNFGVECGSITNFKYNNQTYVSGTMVPIDTIDSLGFFYVPDNNPLGYTVEYPWLVQDDKGLITVIN